MVPWQPLRHSRRAYSWRMETLTSSPPQVKNGPFSKNHSPEASCCSPAGLLFCILHSSFSENATKGCHTILHGEATLLVLSFSHSPFSENSFSILRSGVTTPNVGCSKDLHFPLLKVIIVKNAYELNIIWILSLK